MPINLSRIDFIDTLLNIPSNLPTSSIVASLLCSILIFALMKLSIPKRVATCEKSGGKKVASETEFEYQSTPFNSTAVERIKQEVGDYRPPWWYSKHIGTCVTLGKRWRLPYERDEFESEDTVFSMDWFPHRPPVTPACSGLNKDTASSPACANIPDPVKTPDTRDDMRRNVRSELGAVDSDDESGGCALVDSAKAAGHRDDKINVIILFPGLGLSSDHPFAEAFAVYAARDGFYVAIVNYRGVERPLKSKKFWHPGDNEDAIMAVDFIYHTYRNTARVFLSGFSAGTNILQKTMVHLHRRSKEAKTAKLTKLANKSGKFKSDKSGKSGKSGRSTKVADGVKTGYARTWRSAHERSRHNKGAIDLDRQFASSDVASQSGVKVTPANRNGAAEYSVTASRAVAEANDSAVQAVSFGGAVDVGGVVDMGDRVRKRQSTASTERAYQGGQVVSQEGTGFYENIKDEEKIKSEGEGETEGKGRESTEYEESKSENSADSDPSRGSNSSDTDDEGKDQNGQNCGGSNDEIGRSNDAERQALLKFRQKERSVKQKTGIVRSQSLGSAASFASFASGGGGGGAKSGMSSENNSRAASPPPVRAGAGAGAAAAALFFPSSSKAQSAAASARTSPAPVEVGGSTTTPASADKSRSFSFHNLMGLRDNYTSNGATGSSRDDGNLDRGGGSRPFTFQNWMGLRDDGSGTASKYTTGTTPLTASAGGGRFFSLQHFMGLGDDGTGTPDVATGASAGRSFSLHHFMGYGDDGTTGTSGASGSNMDFISLPLRSWLGWSDGAGTAVPLPLSLGSPQSQRRAASAPAGSVAGEPHPIVATTAAGGGAAGGGAGGGGASGLHGTTSPCHRSENGSVVSSGESWVDIEHSTSSPPQDTDAPYPRHAPHSYGAHTHSPPAMAHPATLACQDVCTGDSTVVSPLTRVSSPLGSTSSPNLVPVPAPAPAPTGTSTAQSSDAANSTSPVSGGTATAATAASTGSSTGSRGGSSSAGIGGGESVGSPGALLESIKESVTEFDYRTSAVADADKISGAFCCCVNYDYLAARTRLESTFVGSIYSMMLAHLFKDIIQKNAHVHEELPGGKERVTGLLSTARLMSDYDKNFGAHLHGYHCPKEMAEELSMFDAHEIPVPLLALQPTDDPLHAGAVRENIKVDRLVENPNIIFMEPRRGNHFGFYEGGLLEAFSCERTYSYPPRVALSFFKSIIAHQQQQEQQQELEKEQQEQKKR